MAGPKKRPGKAVQGAPAECGKGPALPAPAVGHVEIARPDTHRPRLPQEPFAPVLLKTQIKKGTWEVWRIGVDPVNGDPVSALLGVVGVDDAGVETWDTEVELPLEVVPAPGYIWVQAHDAANPLPDFPCRMVVGGPRTTTFELTGDDDPMTDQPVFAGPNGYVIDVWDEAAQIWRDRAWMVVSMNGTIHILAQWSVAIPFQPPFAVRHAAYGINSLTDIFRVVVETPQEQF